jgi:hypothetical protein
MLNSREKERKKLNRSKKVNTSGSMPNTNNQADKLFVKSEHSTPDNNVSFSSEISHAITLSTINLSKSSSSLNLDGSNNKMNELIESHDLSTSSCGRYTEVGKNITNTTATTSTVDPTLANSTPSNGFTNSPSKIASSSFSSAFTKSAIAKKLRDSDDKIDASKKETNSISFRKKVVSSDPSFSSRYRSSSLNLAGSEERSRPSTRTSSDPYRQVNSSPHYRDASLTEHGSSSSSSRKEKSGLLFYNKKLSHNSNIVIQQTNEHLYSCEKLLQSKTKVSTAYLHSITPKSLIKMREKIDEIQQSQDNITAFSVTFENTDDKKNENVPFHEIVTIKKEGMVKSYLPDHSAVLGKGADGKVIITYELPTSIPKDFRDNLQPIALKIFHQELPKDVIEERKKALEKFGHYVNHCTLDTTLFFLQYIDGIELTDYLYEFNSAEHGTDFKGKRYITPGNKIDLFTKVIQALHEFHLNKFVHTDIKTDNLRLKPDHTVIPVDLDHTTDQNIFSTSNQRGTIGLVDPDIISPHYVLVTMKSELNKKNEIQVQPSAEGLLYRTILSKTTHCIPWNILDKNFPRDFKDIKEIKNFYDSILRHITRQGHTGTTCTSRSDRYSEGVVCADIISDFNFHKRISQKLIEKKAKKEHIDQEIKNKIERKLNRHNILDTIDQRRRELGEQYNSELVQRYSEEAIDYITQKELYEILSDVFELPVLGEQFAEKKIEHTWIQLPIDELYNYLMPTMDEILLEDKQKLRNNARDIISDIVFRLYIFPHLAKIAVKLTHDGKRYDDSEVLKLINDLNDLKIKFAILDKNYNNLYETVQSLDVEFHSMINVNTEQKKRLTTRADINDMGLNLHTEAKKTHEKNPKRNGLKLDDKDQEKSNDRVNELSQKNDKKEKGKSEKSHRKGQAHPDSDKKVIDKGYGQKLHGSIDFYGTKKDISTDKSIYGKSSGLFFEKEKKTGKLRIESNDNLESDSMTFTKNS